MRQLCELTLTAPATSDVDGMIRHLVEARLCASGHRDTIATTYRWHGTIHAANEIKAVLHTCTDRVPELEDAIVRWHPYEVPCLAYRPLEASEPYGQWIQDCTS